MNPYLMFAIVAVPTTILVMLGAYLWFRKGLGARIFNFFCPLLAFSVGVGWCAALEPTWTRLLIAAAVEVAVAVPALIMFFKTVVTRLENQTGAMASSISQIAATASEQAATATEQASTVAQVGTTVDEISQTSSAALSSAQKVLSVATEAADKGRKGVQAVADTLRVMERIGEVVEIVETVDDLSEQSNLLAVNAGIEAAKAGEHGRGFAVVATEVRNLAEQSKKATQQIRGAIRRVEEGQSALTAVDTLIRELSEVLEESADSARQISATATQQAAGVQQISEAMTNVSQGGHDTAEAAQQLDSAATTLKTVAADLQKFISG